MRTITCSSPIPFRTPSVTSRRLANISTALSLWSRDVPGEVAVKINDRDARWHDLYRIDLTTGQRTLIWGEHAGAGRAYWPRLAVAPPVCGAATPPMAARSNGASRGRRSRDFGADVPYEDSLTTGVNHFDRSNERALLFVSRSGGDTTALLKLDWATWSARRMLARTPRPISVRSCSIRHRRGGGGCGPLGRTEWLPLASEVASCRFRFARRHLTGREFSVDSADAPTTGTGSSRAHRARSNRQRTICSIGPHAVADRTASQHARNSRPPHGAHASGRGKIP